MILTKLLYTKKNRLFEEIQEVFYSISIYGNNQGFAALAIIESLSLNA